MKQIFFLFILFGAFSASAQGFYLGQSPDCKMSLDTVWSIEKVGKIDTCAHNWVWAQWSEVNEFSGVTSAMACYPCSCGHEENTARVCKECKRHEKGIVRTSWSSPDVKKSLYKKLTEDGN